MPSKPNKYGIKIWVCCDAKNYYVTNFSIYRGKTDGKREKNQGENVVLSLTEHLQQSGFEITTDNSFTSIPLALKLIKRKNKMTLLGTIRKDKKYIPDIIKEFSKKNKDEYSSLFAIAKDLTIVSYIPKKNKSVLILSSSHANNAVRYF